MLRFSWQPKRRKDETTKLFFSYSFVWFGVKKATGLCSDERRFYEYQIQIDVPSSDIEACSVVRKTRTVWLDLNLITGHSVVNK